MIVEIDAAIYNYGKAAGHDDVTPEHMKFGGSSLQTCFCQILNIIVAQKTIPACFQKGILIPCYKGKEITLCFITFTGDHSVACF